MLRRTQQLAVVERSSRTRSRVIQEACFGKIALWAEREIHRDLGFDLDGTAIEKVWLVAPLLHRAHRRRNQISGA